MGSLKIKKLNPVLLDCYQCDKFIGTVSNSYESLSIRLQIAEQKLKKCYFVISPNNTNWAMIANEDRNIRININEYGEVDKWFSEVQLNDDTEPLTSVYSESLQVAIKIRKIQKEKYYVKRK